jgi:serine/threonine protein kinase
MGEVYRARDTRLRREVALKVLPETLASDPSARTRFEREAHAVAALNHPNIVTIHSIEEADGIAFLTMELIEGAALSRQIPPSGLPPSRLFDVAKQVAAAVAAAHEAGVTHRDLKPDNIMVGRDGRVKVLDFGLAKPVDLRPTSAAEYNGETVTRPSLLLTQVGQIVGTLAYMSPEQAEGRPLDSRTDIFSFGVVLYEMATGQRPFRGDSRAALLASILRDEPRSVSELRSSLPAGMERVVRRCLAKDPGRRYQTAIDLRNDLEELAAEVDSAPRPRVALPGRRRSAVMLASAAALAAGLWAMPHPWSAPSVAQTTALPAAVPSEPRTAAGRDDAEIREVLHAYIRSIETQDVFLFRRLKPDLTEEELDRLQKSFAALKAGHHHIVMSIESVDLHGDKATSVVARQDSIDGRLTEPFNQTVLLAKSQGQWSISEIGR